MKTLFGSEQWLAILATGGHGKTVWALQMPRLSGPLIYMHSGFYMHKQTSDMHLHSLLWMFACMQSSHVCKHECMLVLSNHRTAACLLTLMIHPSLAASFPTPSLSPSFAGLCLCLCLSLSLSLSISFSLPLSLSLSLSPTLSHSLSHSHSRAHSHSQSHSLSHTHSLSLSLSISLSISLSLCRSLSLSLCLSPSASFLPMYIALRC